MKTMKIGSQEYAKVADRLKAYREENPTGKIETSFTQLPDGQMILKATIKKENGAEATGQAMGKLDKDKAFEKLESIAVGRALAFLGYLASGEIASSEEMQEFLEYQDTKVADAIAEMEKSTNLEELKEAYKSLGKGLMASEDVIKAKDVLKAKLK
jgi:hypothetical protein